MSSLAAIVSLGHTGWASGQLKMADAVGHLYVGGSAEWRFHRLTGGRQPLSVAHTGARRTWQEIAAAAAVLLHDQPGLEEVAGRLLPLGLSGETVRLDERQVQELAHLVGDVNIAAALTLLDGETADLSYLGDVPGWSVQVAAPVFSRLHSRWGVDDARGAL